MKRRAALCFRASAFAALFATLGVAASAETGRESEPLLSDSSATLLTSEELSGVRGGLLRGGVSAHFGVAPSARTSVRLPTLPAAPKVDGLSERTDAAVKLVMNDVTPLILTTLVGGQIPIAGSSEGAAPLFAGFSFIPVSGRP